MSDPFLCWLTLSERHYLCDDLRRYIYGFYKTDRCTRCGVVVSDCRRFNVCFVRGERLCFTCCHRNLWPKI